MRLFTSTLAAATVCAAVSASPSLAGDGDSYEDTLALIQDLTSVQGSYGSTEPDAVTYIRWLEEEDRCAFSLVEKTTAKFDTDYWQAGEISVEKYAFNAADLDPGQTAILWFNVSTQTIGMESKITHDFTALPGHRDLFSKCQTELESHGAVEIIKTDQGCRQITQGARNYLDFSTFDAEVNAPKLRDALINLIGLCQAE